MEGEGVSSRALQVTEIYTKTPEMGASEMRVGKALCQGNHGAFLGLNKSQYEWGLRGRCQRGGW